MFYRVTFVIAIKMSKNKNQRFSELLEIEKKVKQEMISMEI